jgi:hypothetical protein
MDSLFFSNPLVMNADFQHSAFQRLTFRYKMRLVRPECLWLDALKNGSKNSIGYLSGANLMLR